VTPPGD